MNSEHGVGGGSELVDEGDFELGRLGRELDTSAEDTSRYVYVYSCNKLMTLLYKVYKYAIA